MDLIYTEKAESNSDNESFEILEKGEKLMLSDSENEEMLGTTPSVQSPFKSNQKLVDTDLRSSDSTNKQPTSNGVDEAVQPKLTLSESENENILDFKSTSKPTISESDDDNIHFKSSHRLVLEKLVDTDSSSEEENTKNNSFDETLQHKLMLRDSESEDILSIKPTSGKIHFESDDANIPLESNYTLTIGKLVDTDSSSEEDNAKKPITNNVLDLAAQQKRSKKVHKNNGTEEITTILGETQRLIRDSAVNVPYHKPKQYSLKEFMKRRSIIKPTSIVDKNKKENLKMTQEELELFTKKLEEREKEAKEFFKNDTISNSDLNQNSTIKCDISNTLLDENSKEIISETSVTERQSNSEEKSTFIKDHLSSKSQEISNSPQKDNREIQNNKKYENSVKFSLKGTQDTIINLETGEEFISNNNSKNSLAFETLYQKLSKTIKVPKSTTETNICILSIENSKLQFNNVKLIESEEKECNDRKPGELYLKLKKELGNLISTKRKEDFLKKNEFKEETKKNVEIENENMEEYNENMEEDSENLKCTDINEDGYDEEESAEESESDLNKSEMDESDADDEMENDDYVEDLARTAKKTRNRIITPVDEDSDDECFQSHRTEVTLSNNEDNILWKDDEIKNQTVSENELLGLCSGSFSNVKTQDNVLISQIPSTQINADIDNELINMCSGNFPNETQPSNENNQQINDNNGDFSDEEEPNIFRSKRKQCKILDISDEEEMSLDDCEKLDKSDEDTSSSQSINEAEEVINTYIDYDSEENEIEVNLPKAEIRKQANAFVENEAELSESEWGSADEDENDMDKYDIELADEEEFDQKKLQSELERIHMRRVLDDDKKQIKQIQDMLFEDEENDGIGRERQFRWLNVDTSLENADVNKSDNELKNESEEENEEECRKKRYERENLLNTESISTNKSELDSVGFLPKTKKISELKSKLSISGGSIENDSPFLITKPTSVRGSFLVRDMQTLSKLASLTNLAQDNKENPGFVKLRSNNPNFVFTSVDNSKETEVKQLKRTSSKAKSKENMKDSKKRKLSHSSKNQLIDHLL